MSYLYKLIPVLFIVVQSLCLSATGNKTLSHSTVVKASACTPRMRTLMKTIANESDTFAIPINEIIGGVNKINTFKFIDNTYELIIVNENNHKKYDLAFLLHNDEVVFADALIRTPRSEQLFGSNIWYFLTKEGKFIYWTPHFSPIYLVDLEQVRKNGFKFEYVVQIDIEKQKERIPYGFEFKLQGDGTYDLYLNGKMVKYFQGSMFYTTK